MECHSKAANKERNVMNKSRSVGLVGVLLIAAGGACTSAAIERPPAPAYRSACEGTARANAHEALLRAQNITSVTPLKEKPFVARPSPLKVAAVASRAKLQGARIVLRPTAGMTAEWLQAIANCDRTMGGDGASSSASPTCPFELDGASTTVRSTGDGFAVDVVSDDPQVAGEILTRAQSLNGRN